MTRTAPDGPTGVSVNDATLTRLDRLRASALTTLEAAVAGGSVYASVFVLRETGGLYGADLSDDDLDDPSRLLAAVKEADDRNVRDIVSLADRLVPPVTRRQRGR